MHIGWGDRVGDWCRYCGDAIYRAPDGTKWYDGFGCGTCPGTVQHFHAPILGK